MAITPKKGRVIDDRDHKVRGNRINCGNRGEILTKNDLNW